MLQVSSQRPRVTLSREILLLAHSSATSSASASVHLRMAMTVTGEAGSLLVY